MLTRKEPSAPALTSTSIVVAALAELETLAKGRFGGREALGIGPCPPHVGDAELHISVELHLPIGVQVDELLRGFGRSLVCGHLVCSRWRGPPGARRMCRR